MGCFQPFTEDLRTITSGSRASSSLTFFPFTAAMMRLTVSCPIRIVCWSTVERVGVTISVNPSLANPMKARSWGIRTPCCRATLMQLAALKSLELKTASGGAKLSENISVVVEMGNDVDHVFGSEFYFRLPERIEIAIVAVFVNVQTLGAAQVPMRINP